MVVVLLLFLLSVDTVPVLVVLVRPVVTLLLFLSVVVVVEARPLVVLPLFLSVVVVEVRPVVTLLFLSVVVVVEVRPFVALPPFLSVVVVEVRPVVTLLFLSVVVVVDVRPLVALPFLSVEVVDVRDEPRYALLFISTPPLREGFETADEFLLLDDVLVRDAIADS